MKSTWGNHLVICLFLGLLAVPIYFLDLAFLGSGGGQGNWIKLDFRGLIFWTYITLLAIHFALLAKHCPPIKQSIIQRRVSWMPRTLRVSSWAPTSSSRSRTCRLNEGCDVSNFRAAATLSLPVVL